MPEQFFDPKAGIKGKELRAEIDRLTAFEAADKVRRNALPQSPDAYKVELPKDFKLPQGTEGFKFNEQDPILAQARAVMHDIDSGKLSGQEAFSKLLSLYAGAKLGEDGEIAAAKTAEMTKLGPTAQARVDAIKTWVKATIGEEGMAHIMSGLFTAAQVQHFETLISKHVNGGAGGFRQNGRDPTPVPKVTDEQWNKMTFGERTAYAQQFEQPQHNGHGR